MEVYSLAIHTITMPQLGESVTEGTIEKWIVQVGDVVEKYDPLAEVNTDKVNAEVPSSYSGTITQLIAREGETIAVGEPVCLIETTGEQQIEQPEQQQEVVAKEQRTTKDQSASGRYSPAVMRLAQEHSINLLQVSGTGAGGRITRNDLRKLIASGGQQQQEPVVEKQRERQEREPKQQNDTPVEKGDIEIPITGVRRTIANNMIKAKEGIPHAWMMIEVDVTNLATYRDSVKDSFRKSEGYNLTYFAFFIKAIAQALKEFPIMNSTWAGDKIIQKKDINVSIAVAADDALFVPVVHNADEKTIKVIARDISELAYKARTGKLTSQDVRGGTFTVNNTGSFGSIQSMGIINYPQAAIIQVESIVKRPVIMADNMIGIRHMVNLCLSLDHRVLDGLVCGRFLARVKEILENTTADNTPLY